MILAIHVLLVLTPIAQMDAILQLVQMSVPLATIMAQLQLLIVSHVQVLVTIAMKMQVMVLLVYPVILVFIIKIQVMNV